MQNKAKMKVQSPCRREGRLEQEQQQRSLKTSGFYGVCKHGVVSPRKLS
jgi:hypothetical protein